MTTDQRQRGAPAQARYDGFAEWYERWIGDKPPLIADHAGELLPGMAGRWVLDVACGQGRMSRYLAAAGASVTGIDISAAVLRPGGWFAASVVHPCLPGSERGLSSWPPGQGL